jgi:hypothetical protein
MSHIVKLGWAAIVGVQVVTGVTTIQTDPGVQTASRGTGATIINLANDPKGFIAFFNDVFKRFRRGVNVWPPRAETTAAGVKCVHPAEGDDG